MKKHHTADKNITFHLAQKSLLGEERLKFEQRVMLHIVRFVQDIKSKNQQSILAIKVKLLMQYQNYSKEDQFFESIVKVVNKQLRKFDK